MSSGREAAAVVPDSHPDSAAILSNLSAALTTRFSWNGAMADLDAAVTAGRGAVAAAPDGHPDRAATLANLSVVLRERFDRTGTRPDLDDAIAAGEKAVYATTADHPARAGRLSGLSAALRTRFEQAGNPADLRAAVAAGQEAATTVPDGHPSRAAVMANLSGVLAQRFEYEGELPDLDAAIAAGQEAVTATPAGHPALTAIMSGLATTWAVRFGQNGDLTDLDAAISAFRASINAAPAGFPNRATILSNLAFALGMRYERTGVKADLDAGAQAARQAVEATKPGHPHRSAMLSGLGVILRVRSAQTGSLSDLDDAITAGRDAVAAVPAGHPDTGPALANLGAALAVRSDRVGELTDLDAAIAADRAAIDLMRADQPSRAMMLSNLGAVLVTRFERTAAPADLNAAISAQRDAAETDTAPPRVRAAAARRWGWAAGIGERWPESVAGFEAAASLLGRVAPRSLTRPDQEHLLEELDGMASQAAACCVRAGQPGRAVELLEQCRGILLGQALDTRTDLTELAARHPDLARRFSALRDDLDQVDSPFWRTSELARAADEPAGSTATRARRTAERQRELAQFLDQVITDIRTKPDFDAFLRPPPIHDLTVAAAAGPVVIVNASRFGSHALILTSEGLLDPVPLNDLTPSQVLGQVARFLRALDGAFASRQAQDQLTTTLGWLWDVIAEPVLDRLGIIRPPSPGQDWPRLWWCLPGVLSFLPLHAAGHHDTRADAHPRTVIDRVISSYTPTIRALIHARRIRAADDPQRAPATDPGHIAVIAMPHTPDAADLDGAAAESTLLTSLFPQRTRTFTGPEATHDTVTAALAAARWAHFACHASADPTSPSASRLLLHDHLRQPLTAADIARLRLNHADLAFLSACSTAASKGERLADEAIHLASAFQLAGYRHVIGTLWPVGDRAAVSFATEVYQKLAGTGTDHAATVLHVATRQIRDVRPRTPSAWASHIHSGP